MKVLMNLSSGEMSLVEKNAAKELRETARQVAKLEKSVARVKKLSTEVQPVKVNKYLILKIFFLNIFSRLKPGRSGTNLLCNR